ncbi:MAG TPA: PAS domain S-box protein [Candidatus Acidoferrum sp.]|nr:PAS domain S-box protein [Candidatus Acidoferrum sp.]
MASPPSRRVLYLNLWISFGLAVLVVQAALTFIVGNRITLSAYCESTYLIFLLFAACLSALNALDSRQAIRLFWSFLAMALAVWAILPIGTIYQVVLGRWRNPLFDTTPGFLHIVLFIAAIAARPNIKLAAANPYRNTLNFLILLFFGVFIYAYTLAPYTYDQRSPSMIFRYEILYLAANLMLLSLLAWSMLRSAPPWKSIYGNLLGASMVYAFGSLVANLEWAWGRYHFGGLTGLPFSASILWFGGVALAGRKMAGELEQSCATDTWEIRRVSIFTAISVLAIPFFGIFELLRGDEDSRIRSIRLMIVLCSILLLGVAGFFRYVVANRQLSSDVQKANQSVVRQAQFEALTSQISSDLIDAAPRHLGAELQKSLASLREFLGVDRISLFEFDEKRSSFRLRHAVKVEELEAAPDVLTEEDYPWLFAQLVRSKMVVITDLEDLPNGAAGERELFQKLSPGMLVLFPLTVEAGLVGILGCAVVDRGGSSLQVLLPQLKVVSQVCANAFSRELGQKALFESEGRLRLMSEAAPAFLWMSDRDGKISYLNRKIQEFTGASADKINGDGWFAFVHPEDSAIVHETKSRALQHHERFFSEYRLRRYDGDYRWMFEIENPRFSADGSFLGYIGSAVDVTEQKLAREALAKVGGQLIAAQEKERSHLARELHDDICQRLAMLSLRIEKATRGLSSGQLSVGEQLEQIWQQCSELTGDVQALSHELHPTILDNLGLVTAIRSFCREISEQSGVEIQFTVQDVPDALPREVSLSLFRVAQEALHNAVKYSGQKHLELNLRGVAGQLELEVVDRGVGFDVDRVSNSQGLGLVSMSERIHLLNGNIRIESKPNIGTRIHAVVPVQNRANAVGAD